MIKKTINNPLINEYLSTVSEGNLSNLQNFINQNDIDINSVNNKNENALHLLLNVDNDIVSQYNKYLITDFLIKNKIRVNAYDKSGNLPLHIAIKNNLKDIVKLLLDNKADPKLTNNEKMTSLHIATKQQTIPCDIEYSIEPLINNLKDDTKDITKLKEKSILLFNEYKDNVLLKHIKNVIRDTFLYEDKIPELLKIYDNEIININNSFTIKDKQYEKDKLKQNTIQSIDNLIQTTHFGFFNKEPILPNFTNELQNDDTILIKIQTNINDINTQLHQLSDNFTYINENIVPQINSNKYFKYNNLLIFNNLNLTINDEEVDENGMLIPIIIDFNKYYNTMDNNSKSYIDVYCKDLISFSKEIINRINFTDYESIIKSIIYLNSFIFRNIKIINDDLLPQIYNFDLSLIKKTITSLNKLSQQFNDLMNIYITKLNRLNVFRILDIIYQKNNYDIYDNYIPNYKVQNDDIKSILPIFKGGIHLLQNINNINLDERDIKFDENNYIVNLGIFNDNYIIFLFGNEGGKKIINNFPKFIPQNIDNFQLHFQLVRLAIKPFINDYLFYIKSILLETNDEFKLLNILLINYFKMVSSYIAQIYFTKHFDSTFIDSEYQKLINNPQIYDKNIKFDMTKISDVLNNITDYNNQLIRYDSIIAQPINNNKPLIDYVFNYSNNRIERICYHNNDDIIKLLLKYNLENKLDIFGNIPIYYLNHKSNYYNVILKKSNKIINTTINIDIKEFIKNLNDNFTTVIHENPNFKNNLPRYSLDILKMFVMLYTFDNNEICNKLKNLYDNMKKDNIAQYNDYLEILYNLLKNTNDTSKLTNINKAIEKYKSPKLPDTLDCKNDIIKQIGNSIYNKLWNDLPFEENKLNRFQLKYAENYYNQNNKINETDDIFKIIKLIIYSHISIYLLKSLRKLLFYNLITTDITFALSQVTIIINKSIETYILQDMTKDLIKWKLNIDPSLSEDTIYDKLLLKLYDTLPKNNNSKYYEYLNTLIFPYYRITFNEMMNNILKTFDYINYINLK